MPRNGHLGGTARPFATPPICLRHRRDTSWAHHAVGEQWRDGPLLACQEEITRPFSRAGDDSLDTYTILAEAISSKQQVVAYYHDRERVFSPHALGTKGDAAHVLVFQYGGGSESGLPPGGEWRCLNLDELSDIRLEPGAWRTAANVFNPQSCLDEIDVVADPLPPRKARGQTS